MIALEELLGEFLFALFLKFNFVFFGAGFLGEWF